MTEQSNPLFVLTLWYKPGQTMQGLIAKGQGHRLAIAVAMSFGLVQAGRFYIGSADSGQGILTAGIFAGLIGLFFFAWLLRNFSRWFGGQATMREVRTALGLGLLPWTLLFGVLAVAMASVDDASSLEPYYLLFFAVFIYGYIILLMCLSAALKVSVLKTFLCLVITFLVSMFPLTLLMQAFMPNVAP